MSLLRPSAHAPSTRSPSRSRKLRTALHLLVGAAAAVASGAASMARADDWVSWGRDTSRARHAEERSGATFSDGRWSATFAGGARVLASPSAADGYVITVDLEGAVHALDAADGRELWHVALRSAVHGSPAVVQGRVFIPTFGNKLIALRLRDGALVWQRDLGGALLSSPTPVGGDIILAVGLPERRVVRVSGASGEVVWRSPPVMEQLSHSSPAIGRGLVVVGSNGGHYYAFEEATGDLRWDYLADGIVHLASPLIAGDRVYMAGGGSSDRVHAVDAATGVRIPGWPVELPNPDLDVPGKAMARTRAVSSFSAAGGLLLLQTRVDQALDTDGDLAIDKYLSRETVFGLAPDTGTVQWQRAVARGERTDPNDVPKFFVCPTPVSFATTSGTDLAAIASSLDATVRILEVATGAEREQVDVAGPALASPVFANGRLIVSALNGRIEGLLSSVHHPPAAPTVLPRPRPLDRAEGNLRWVPAATAAPDESYELRVDSDGEWLETWMQRSVTGAGVTSARLTGPLRPGLTYTFAVRARDAYGATSPWSLPGTFEVANHPPVNLNGARVAGLREAVRLAKPGDEVVLADGTYDLDRPLLIGAGVSIRGAGAGRTKLNASGLAVGLRFDGDPTAPAAGLEGVTVTGADTCVSVAQGHPGVRLEHVVAHDCRVAGIVVEQGGHAAIANATLVANTVGVHAFGDVTIKNSLLTENGLALMGDACGTLVSTYDDLFDNQTDYLGTTAGSGDISVPVVFANLGQRDLRLLQTQPSTDKGDPSDTSGAEPFPDGDRINLGAFGGTAEAEPSLEPAPAAGGDGAPPLVGGNHTAPVGSGTTTPKATRQNAGCALGGGPGSPSWTMSFAVIGLLMTRRRGARARKDT